MTMTAQTAIVTEGYTLTVEEPGRIGHRAEPMAALAARQVRLKTLFSGISAGTEMTAFLGSNPYLTKRWNGETRLFETSSASWSYPMPAIGYEEVGEVVEVGPGVTKVATGQIIWGAWGHKSHHVESEDWCADRILPAGADPEIGIFSQIGGIALNAVIDANIHLGETVAIFGQGALGLMVTQMAKANGARVIAVDRMARRLDEAKKNGADHVVNGGETDAALAIKALTGGRGADVTIEISGSSRALNDAIRSTAYNSRVIACGFYQGEGAGLYLGEEFHHNRIQVICSQIGGLNPSLDHRWDRLRLDQTAIALNASGKVNFRNLISHRFKATEAQAAFDLLKNAPQDALQIVLDFRD
jgi:2-desacetyl-2-hydroxyethyl bacteriochlorophyllide A dehydrogenase